MKLRFDHQSLRLRVRKSEVEQLEKTSSVEEWVHFPGSTLCYRLQLLESIEQPQVEFTDGVLRVFLPEKQGREWMQSDLVGIYADLPTGDATEKTISLIIEKDFPCKHGDSVSNLDTFAELADQ